MIHFTFLISKKVIEISPRYLWWISSNIISFFSENFTVEISTPVEYSTKNWFVGYPKNAKNGHLTAKNTIFQRFRPLYAQYLGFGSKWPIDTLSNLPIINIGRIGQFINNRKLWAFFSLVFAYAVGKLILLPFSRAEWAHSFSKKSVFFQISLKACFSEKFSFPWICKMIVH